MTITPAVIGPEIVGRLSGLIAASAHPEPWHLTRYTHTWSYVKSVYDAMTEARATRGQIGPAKLLDLGNVSPFFQFLCEQFGSSEGQVQNTCEQELRARKPDGSISCANSEDVILMLEVIEHLKDLEGGDRATFDASGITACLAGVATSLVSGGYLIITTPNPTGWIALGKILVHDHPFMYKPHPRELAPGDVTWYVEDAGLRVELVTTLDVWDRHSVSDEQVQRFVAAGFTDDGLRGDMTLVIARKP